MQQKNLIRKKYYKLRKKKYFDVSETFFSPLSELIKFKFKKKKIKLALYYPSSFEINVIKLLKINSIFSQNILLPVIGENNSMNFFPWKKNEVLLIK